MKIFWLFVLLLSFLACQKNNPVSPIKQDDSGRKADSIRVAKINSNYDSNAGQLYLVKGTNTLSMYVNFLDGRGFLNHQMKAVTP